MKLITTLVLGFLVYSNSAYAIFSPGYERPIMAMQGVNVLSATGDLSEIKRVSLTLHQIDGKPQIQSLSLVLQGKVIWLDIVNREPSDCGSILVTAVERKVQESQIEVLIEDHTTRVCKDLKPNTWEVQVEHKSTQGELLGSLELGGDLQPVYSIQGSRNTVSF